MRIRIDYDTRYTYDTPARAAAQLLRMTPRNCDSQYVSRWRVEIDVDTRAPLSEDAFGNITHAFFTHKPLSHLTISVSGEVDTTDTHGLVTGVPERLHPDVFLRETSLTVPDAPLRAFAADVAASSKGDTLERLHALLAAVHRNVAFDVNTTHAATSASEAFAHRSGVCQDLSHIFIACSRHLGIPARYVSGHLVKLNGEVAQQASHAWAEALVPGLGWVGFDVANGVCPSETHVRVAVGFDYLSAAPVRGVRVGGGAEHLAVKLAVANMDQQQTQSAS